MSGKESGARGGGARDQLFWTLAEHCSTDTRRLQHLTNTVNEDTARTIYDSCIHALDNDKPLKSAIDSVVAELERASVLEEGNVHAGGVEGGTSTGLHRTIAAGDRTPQPVQQEQQLLQAYDRCTILERQPSQRPHVDVGMLPIAPMQSHFNTTAPNFNSGAPLLTTAATSISTKPAFNEDARYLRRSSGGSALNGGAPLSNNAAAVHAVTASAQSLPQNASLFQKGEATCSSPSGVSKSFADLSLRVPGGEEPVQVPSASPHSISPRVLSQPGAVRPESLRSVSMNGSLPQQPRHVLPQASSTPMLHNVYPEQRFPTPPHPQQSPPIVSQPLQRPLATRMPHSSGHAAQQRPPMAHNTLRQCSDPLSGSSVPLPDLPTRSSLSHQNPSYPPHAHTMPPAPIPQYNTHTLQQIVSAIQNPANPQMPYGMLHPTASIPLPMQQQAPLPFGIANGNAGNPMQSAPSIPTWCVVTGLPKATLPPSVPPDGVLNVSHLLPWPPAVRKMLQLGFLGLTLDPTIRESRGQIDQPSVMLMVTQPGTDQMSGAGLTYRDMYLGRQNLPEAWWMPAHWETETTEIVLEDLDRVRLVLSYRGLSLLSNSYEPFFLCVQSALMVLCNAPGDVYAGAGESEVGKLLWEFMRTSMDCLQRMADAKQHSSRGSDSRGASTEPLRGSWLQRLNHEKQKLALMIDWHDRQQPDLTWVSTLLINGEPVKFSEASVKKQDARNSAARMYLISIGIHGHD